MTAGSANRPHLTVGIKSNVGFQFVCLEGVVSSILSCKVMRGDVYNLPERKKE